jgi:hypothetical protein
VPSFLKLTLRDLLWLALLIAGLTAWGMQRSRSIQRAESLKRTDFVRVPGSQPTPLAAQLRVALDKFAASSDEELDEQFGVIAASTQWHHAADYEPCLTEMVRRKMVDELQKHYDALMARDLSVSGFPYNLELLTALRRAQGKPDPLQIEISLVDPKTISMEPQAPAVQARITNVDAEKQPVHFTRGGDYRGGRRERWRATLTDEWGRAVRDSNFQSWIGGGIASLGPFEFGAVDADGHAFDLRRYVAPARSGKYRLQLFYHNQLNLADEPDMTGLIVMKSKPLDVVISVPARNKGLSPGLQTLLAIAAAAALLAGISYVANKKLSIRDIVWACLLVAVALGVWLDGRYWENQIARLSPDADSSWSIALVQPPAPAGR